MPNPWHILSSVLTGPVHFLSDLHAILLFYNANRRVEFELPMEYGPWMNAKMGESTCITSLIHRDGALRLALKAISVLYTGPHPPALSTLCFGFLALCPLSWPLCLCFRSAVNFHCFLCTLISCSLPSHESSSDFTCDSPEPSQSGSHLSSSDHPNRVIKPGEPVFARMFTLARLQRQKTGSNINANH